MKPATLRDAPRAAAARVWRHAHDAQGFDYFGGEAISAACHGVVTPHARGGDSRHGGVGDAGACADTAPDALGSIVCAAKARTLRAGSIVGLSGAPKRDRRWSYCFFANERSLLAIADGTRTAPSMAFNGPVEVDVFDERSAIRRSAAPPKQRRSRRRADF
jgi:hypothetical protein